MNNITFNTKCLECKNRSSMIIKPEVNNDILMLPKKDLYCNKCWPGGLYQLEVWIDKSARAELKAAAEQGRSEARSVATSIRATSAAM